VEKWVVLAFVIGLFVVMWRSRPKPRVPAPKVDARFYESFQAHAVEVGREVFRLAIRRLGNAEVDALVIRRAAEELAEKLGALRASDGDATLAAEAEWEYLGACHGCRFPALSGLADSGDLPALERLAAADPVTADEIISHERATLQSMLDAGVVLLDRDPEAIWGDLELVVLTLVVRKSTPDEEIAAALRAGRHAKRGPVSQDWRAVRELAWRLAHSTPPAARKLVDSVPALDSEDPELGAAFVRFHWNEVAQKSELERALALSCGQFELLWLAQEIVRSLAYPEPSRQAWQALRPLGERALSGDDPTELLGEARARIGELAAERIGSRLPAELSRFK
jgi:hypothetical protein